MRRALTKLQWVVAVWATVLVVGRAGGTVDGGKAAYLRYCANCHGGEGRGDGPDASRFVRPPRNLREGVLRAYSGDELVDRVFSGRHLALQMDPTRLADLTAEADQIIEHLRRLSRAHWPQVERGWALYTVRCSTCHGPYGNPPEFLPQGVKRPRHLSDRAWQEAASDAALLAVVRHGRAGMPALVPQISADEARALLTFVRLLSPGFERYQRVCAVCHGDDGRGVKATSGEVVKLPQVRFDRGYFASRSQAQLRAAVLHMVQEHEPAMPHFATVLDRDTIRAIVEYLRGLP
ncbi:MAG: c-type cytochrome [Candidatus Binatia bacterium]|nr:c-type cytochrome [Candidatus Binatia bacterium]